MCAIVGNGIVEQIFSRPAESRTLLSPTTYPTTRRRHVVGYWQASRHSAGLDSAVSRLFVDGTATESLLRRWLHGLLTMRR